MTVKDSENTKYFCCQPVHRAEEEEEESSCGSPQSATTSDVTGEEGNDRAAENAREICSAD